MKKVPAREILAATEAQLVVSLSSTMTTSTTLGSLLLMTATAMAEAPGEAAPVPQPTTSIPTVRTMRDAEAKAPEWGGGVRLMGLSGVGALPGVNYGGEIAVFVRHHTLFAELGFGRWQPEETVVVAVVPERVELGLDTWTVRAGWASDVMPLRAYVLAEAGEIASPDKMAGLARMVTMSMPAERRWTALGGGIGVAWPMADNARLVGTVEFAARLGGEPMVMEQGGKAYDAGSAARANFGIELGWR